MKHHQIDTSRDMDKEEAECLERHKTDEPIPGKVYLHLYHGRTDPEQDMDDWGSDGPHFGPLKFMALTYRAGFRLFFEDGEEVGPMCKALQYHDDVLHYDGVYYGDWSVGVE